MTFTGRGHLFSHGLGLFIRGNRLGFTFHNGHFSLVAATGAGAGSARGTALATAVVLWSDRRVEALFGSVLSGASQGERGRSGDARDPAGCPRALESNRIQCSKRQRNSSGPGRNISRLNL